MLQFSFPKNTLKSADSDA